MNLNKFASRTSICRIHSLNRGITTIHVEIADSPSAIMDGLMHRDTLPWDSGMVFIFHSLRRESFWMKNTYIPLSIAFWNDNDIIVDILDMEPCDGPDCPPYTPQDDYVGAIEVNQGFFKEHGIDVGDRVELIPIETKGRMSSKLFVDDTRDPEDDSWDIVRTGQEAIERLMHPTSDITIVSLDHDLGEESDYDGSEVAKRILNRVLDDEKYNPPEIRVHSANPIGADRIKNTRDDIERVKTSWHPERTQYKTSAAVTKRDLDIPIHPDLMNALHELHGQGHQSLVVGGAVRDAITGDKPKDIDVEVYGPSYDHLTKTLNKHGKVDVVGKAFGVIKFTDSSGEAHDIGLPRKDSKSGVGHKDFEVKTDPGLNPKEAAARRDFTINCFAGETKIITRQGTKSILKLSGGYHELLTEDGSWIKAPVQSFGKQQLMRIVFSRNGVKKEIFATPNHRWVVRNNHTSQYTSQKTTETLRPGNRVPSVFPSSVLKTIDREAVARGFVFGDGSLSYDRRHESSATSYANFCGEKDLALLPYFEKLDYGRPPRKYSNMIRINSLPPDWKLEYPILDSHSNYLYGWLAGYFAADGCVDKSGSPFISSNNKDNLEYVKLLCQQIGIGTYSIRNSCIGGGYKPENITYNLTLVRSSLTEEFFIIPNHRKRFIMHKNVQERTGWNVDSVKMTNRYEEVYCAIVPNTETFCLEDNILTKNSMGWNPITKEFHDHYGGEEDLKNKVLRHTSDAFSEDPLRVLRGMQFATRYGMTLHPDTAKLSRSISDQYDTIPKERVSEEFMKMATKGKEPGRALDYLHETGWAKHFPHLASLKGTEQDSEWHPEGDVHEHTKHAMNAAAKICDEEGISGDDRAVAVLGTMVHDIGKPTSSQVMEKGGRDRITSHGHEQEGGPLARKTLESIGIKPDIVDKVQPIVENHLAHINFEDGDASQRTIRRLAQRLHPASVKDASIVMRADHAGRPPLSGDVPTGVTHMLKAAEDNEVTLHKQEPIIKGRHVLEHGIEPGPPVGKITRAAYEAQTNGEFSTEEEGKNWLQDYMAKSKTSSWKQVIFE